MRPHARRRLTNADQPGHRQWNLTNSFRPAFSDDALARSATDLRTSSTFAADLRTKAAPAQAQHLTTERPAAAT